MYLSRNLFPPKYISLSHELCVCVYIYICMQTALRKPREERATAICDQSVELLRECHHEYQHISEMCPGSSDSLSEALDTGVLKIM